MKKFKTLKEARKYYDTLRTGTIILSNGFYYVETKPAMIRSCEKQIAEKYDGEKIL